MKRISKIVLKDRQKKEPITMEIFYPILQKIKAFKSYRELENPQGKPKRQYQRVLMENEGSINGRQ